MTKDVLITVVVGVVLALAFMYVLMSLVFAGWGDPPGAAGSATGYGAGAPDGQLGRRP